MKGLVIDKTRETSRIVETAFGLYEVTNTDIKHSVLRKTEVGDFIEFDPQPNMLVGQDFIEGPLYEFIYRYDDPF